MQPSANHTQAGQFSLEPPRDRHLEFAVKLAHLADNRFLDPLLGLAVPGLGDALGALLGLHAVGLALARRAPKIIVARMLLNLALDVGLGLVPIVGDIGDFVFRAHIRNIELLRARIPTAGCVPETRPSDWLLVGGAAAALALALALPLLAAAGLLAWLLGDAL